MPSDQSHRGSLATSLGLPPRAHEVGSAASESETAQPGVEAEQPVGPPPDDRASSTGSKAPANSEPLEPLPGPEAEDLPATNASVASQEDAPAAGMDEGAVLQAVGDKLSTTGRGAFAGLNRELVKAAAGNWTKNILAVAARDGVHTLVATLARELSSQAIIKRLDTQPDEAKLVVSSVLTGCVGLMTLQAMVTQEANKTANAMTRTGHVLSVTALVAAVALAVKTDQFSDQAAALTKAVVYSSVRDGWNMFHRLQSTNDDAAKGLQVGAILADIPEYFGLQMALNTVETLPSAYTGTSDQARTASAREAVGPFALVSLANAVGEFTFRTAHEATLATFAAMSQQPGGRMSNLAGTRVTTSWSLPSLADVGNGFNNDMTGRMMTFVSLTLLTATYNFWIGKNNTWKTPDEKQLVQDIFAALTFACLTAAWHSRRRLDQRPARADLEAGGATAAQPPAAAHSDEVSLQDYPAAESEPHSSHSAGDDAAATPPAPDRASEDSRLPQR